MSMSFTLYKLLSLHLICFIPDVSPLDDISGKTPVHFILYAAIIIAVTWFLIRSQTLTLFRTRRLLREREEALAQLENQRADLEQKNKSITESLTYAQRIQEALLPSEGYLRQFFTHSFILYKPRDIVSGDFYWIGEKGDKRFIIAADCTGHGVPGALMSMIGHDLLEKVINNENRDSPGKILDRMHKSLEETFTREKNRTTVIRDGMDIGICSIDVKNRKIEFAGAFFPLYIIRDNRLIEIKGDKYTLGMAPDGISFRNSEADLLENDMIYLFSDGYVDQFGGEENKKFMYRRFRYLLMTIHRFPLEDQKAILEENIRTWQGSNAQVDDILVIGIKPL
jgi:serine phosphatase RsbU (regulator of sigma subunit)